MSEELWSHHSDMKNPIILDVSLRDGGYLNDWKFSQKSIDLAVTTAGRADADFIEIGYCDDEPGLPKAASCPASMIERVRDLTGHRRIAAMIRPSVVDPEGVLAKRQGLLDLLRIPVNVRDPEPAIKLANLIHRYGFNATLNLTSISCHSTKHFKAVSSRVPDFVAAVYLADSRGAMVGSGVEEIVTAVRSEWKGSIGYHAHDSLGQAVETTRAALEAGCEWIDGSIAGIGIGGRNLTLEDALKFGSSFRSDLNPDPDAFLVTESDLGLKAPGEEMALYRAGGQRNIRQEWVEPLMTRFGPTMALTLINSLPKKAWFEESELEPFIELLPKEVQR